MSNPKLRAELLTALQSLATGNLRTGATALLGKLGYASHKTLDLPTEPNAFTQELENLLGGSKQPNPIHANLAEWKSAAFLFQLTNDELPALAAGQLSLLTQADGVQAWQVASFVFLALDLRAGVWSRTHLAALTRELNCLFPMPAIVLFRHPREDGVPLLSVAVIHRRANKRDATLDVIEGKVSIIKDIDLHQPHAAHLRILASMALTEVDAKFVPSSFEALYKAWLIALDVKALNDRFYKELAEWYYWAIRVETGVVFPHGQPLEESDDPATKNRPTVAMIRLLTRLIFVWFLKEKRLVPAELFDEKALAKLLKHAPHQHDGQSNYYKAILQNLFFATLNTEMAAEDEDGNKQRVWREAAGPKRLQKYLIHTVYRYHGDFKDAAAALELFRKVPFLNGGLFECLDKLITPGDLARDAELVNRVVKEGNQTILRVDGFSERLENPLRIPNELFFGEGVDEVNLNDVFGTKNKKYRPRGLLKIFDSYKFTIEENTPIEEEVALDPELLGKVFENLLASYNPDTKTTARKKSGSFYTPREVVDYMVDEALVSCLERPLSTVSVAQAAPIFVANGLLDLDAGPGDLPLTTGSAELLRPPAPHSEATPKRLRRLLSYRHTGHDFTPAETHTLIAAIEQLRVLDPACGSGAFPMGMLQKLVSVLRKLDPDNTLWKAQNRAPLAEQLASAKSLKDPTLRDEQTTAAEAALAKFDADFADPDYADYARKLYLIEKCLYGVDIQPIAVQIAKLRFFISLVVEQKLGTAHQRLTPLPNLETKIVAANTLLPIPRSDAQQSLLTNPDIALKEAELREANASHFAAKRFADKRKRKERILRLRDELAELLQAELTLKPGDAKAMTAWDPFDQNIHAEFFDPEWMFGFTHSQGGQGFDIVIGNPPYVRQESIKDDKPRLKPHYQCYSPKADLYVYFYERSCQLLNPGGVLSFITSNKWLRTGYGEALRVYMTTNTEMRQLLDFDYEDIFSALAYPSIVIACKRSKPILTNEATNEVRVLNWKKDKFSVNAFPDIFAVDSFAIPQADLSREGWQLAESVERKLLSRLRTRSTPLGDYCEGRLYRGIITGLNEAFVIDAETRCRLIAEEINSVELIKPYLRGRDVKRWTLNDTGLYLIAFPFGFHQELQRYPAILRHLTSHEVALRNRGQCKSSRNGKAEGQHHWLELDNNPRELYLAEFERPKIIIPAIALLPSAAIDLQGYFSNNKSTIIIPPSIGLAAAAINSSVATWFAMQKFATKQGGFYDFEPRYSRQIPVPPASSQQLAVVETIVSTISEAVSKPEFERLLNGLVYELFFPEDLHAKAIRLFDACAAAGIREGMDAQAIATAIFHPRHPIYGMLFELQTLDVVRIIESQA